MDIDRLIEQYSTDLTRLCLSLCSNCVEAEDLFQETWLKALRHGKRYKTDKPFDKWLFAICINTYKNSLKSAYNRMRLRFSSEEEEEAFWSAIPDRNEGNSEDYSELHAAIGKLPKKQRVVLALYYFKDYSVREIAEIVNVPEGTVKSRLSAARDSIKRRLESYEPDI